MIRWENTLSGPLREILEKTQDLDPDLAVGAVVILNDSNSRVPKETGRLVSSGVIRPDRENAHTVAIEYGTPYARWIHEHLSFHHPRGGQAKFLETAMLVKGNEAINIAGEHLWRRL